MLFIKKFSVLALTLAATSVFAGPTVQYDSFGTLSAATFNGSGIPNNAVAITNLAGNVTLGLTATPRFSSPAVTNNGLGTFQAVTGAYGPGDNLALWSFNFYIGDATRNTYNYKLFGDFNAGAGDLDSSYTDLLSAYLNQAATPDSFATPGTIQNSENFGFGTSFAQFDPNAAGEYGIYLAAYDKVTGAEVGRSAILVNVSQVPEPASLALVGLALLGIVGSRRRRSRD